MNDGAVHIRVSGRRSGLVEKIGALLPVRHIVLTGYARNALYLLVRAMGWDRGDEIIIPAFTCSVIPMTLREAGAVPVPVDAEAHGINIDPSLIERAITDRTRAIYVVHSYGIPARIDEICAIAAKYSLKVIEDCAQSLFGSYRGRDLGTWGDFALLSFTKKIVNFEGGALATGDTSAFYRIVDLQGKLHRERHFSPAGFMDQLVRIISSRWESRFPFLVLLVFKLMDMINTLIYKGKYGVSINPERFKMHPLAEKLTSMQLQNWFTGTKGNRCAESVKIMETSGAIQTPGGINVSREGCVEYYTGIPVEDSFLSRLLSFRTWHNFNQRGRFPRADYLYDKYRIFSRLIITYLAMNRKKRGERHNKRYNSSVSQL